MKCDEKNMVYDAHIHIPVKYENPYNRLMDECHKSRLEGGLLIINTKDEADIFWKHYRDLKDGELGFIPDIAWILNVHSRDWKSPFDKLSDLNQKYAVKIHPRISNITRDDFDKVLDCVKQIETENVIIDNWIYGPSIENHIGTELTIYLAERLTDKRIVMAHSGGVRILETMLLTRPISNLWYDLAETCQYFPNTSVYMDMLHFIKYTNNRIMFGSDYPDFEISHSINMMEDALDMANVSEDEVNDIMYATAKKIYGEGIRRVVEECDSIFLHGITTREDYEEILSKMEHNAEVIAIELKGELVGYASIYVNDITSKHGYISMFGIKAKYQKKGFGKYLMDQCCVIAKDAGMNLIGLEVLKENQKGYNFYYKYGFRKNGIETEDSYFLEYGLS